MNETTDTTSRVREAMDIVKRAVRKIIYEPLLVEDAVQDAMLKIIEHGYLSRNFPKGWVYKVAYTTACDNLRKQKRSQPKAGFVELGPCDTYSDNPNDSWTVAVCDNVAEPDLLPAIRDALQTISPLLRHALLLNCEGYSCADIANMTGANLGTVRTRIHYARKRIQPLLEAFV